MTTASETPTRRLIRRETQEVTETPVNHDTPFQIGLVWEVGKHSRGILHKQALNCNGRLCWKELLAFAPVGNVSSVDFELLTRHTPDARLIQKQNGAGAERSPIHFETQPRLLGKLEFTSKVNTRDLDGDANVVAASRLRQLTLVVQILLRRQSFHNCRRAKSATVLPSRQSEATKQRRCTSRGKDNFTRPTKNDSLSPSQGIGRRFHRCFVGFR